MARSKNTRRGFIRGAAGALAVAQQAPAQSAGRVRGFDHVAVPMQNAEAMVAFYKSLGWDVVDNGTAFSVYCGDNMLNFHKPAHWHDPKFTLRAPSAQPPCGDFCFVWEGSPESLKAMLDKANAKIFEGPGPRRGGRRKMGSSVYVRDPDGNLLEFMIYS